MTAPPLVALGEILTAARDEVAVDSETTYRTAGMYSFGRGVFERSPVLGADTSYKTLNRLHAGQFAVSKLNGWEGAVDVVEQRLNGCFVSSEYLTFDIDHERVLPAYMALIARWDRFWDALVPRGSMVRRRRVQVEQMLGLRIPLPPIADQLQIVDWVGKVNSTTSSVTRLAKRSSDLLIGLGVSACSRPDLDDGAKANLGWSKVDLAAVMSQSVDRVRVEPGRHYPNLGIYSFGRGVFEKPDIDGAMTSATVLNRVQAGQFIYSRLFAFEGAYAYVPPEFDGYFVSNEFPSFDPDPHRLDARWLATYLRSAERWAELAGASKGLGVRRQRIPIEAILAYEVWLPPIEVERSMVETIDEIDRASQARAENAKRVSALVPAALNKVFAGLS